MADLTPLDYGQAPTSRAPAGPLAFAAAVFAVLGLVFLPFGPVGLVLGGLRLCLPRGRTRNGVAFGVTAVIVGWLSTVALGLVVAWLWHRPPAGPGGGRP